MQVDLPLQQQIALLIHFYKSAAQAPQPISSALSIACLHKFLK